MREIPILIDGDGNPRPSFRVAVPLDGAVYLLGFHWNARAAAWFFDLASADGTLVLSGRPLRVARPIYIDVRDGVPPGAFVVIDTGTANEDPGRNDLGKRVRVYFLGIDEL